MKLNIKIVSFFSIISLLLFACAQQVAPTGGPKDFTPPKVLKSSPKNGTLNYQNEAIEIRFDEYVKLKQLKKELLVSPPLKHNLRTQLKGRSLIINIQDTLKENTTYVLNFGKSIVDITEDNPINNFQYVFATGDTIDSLSISGRVVDAYSLKVKEDVLVLLHEKHDSDSTISKKRPNYISRTDKNGLFTVQNVKKGKYQLYALKDRNDNFLFDKGEKIAFYTDVVNVNDSKLNDSLKLYLFEVTKKTQYLDERKERGPNYSLQFKFPLEDFHFKILDTTENVLLHHEISEDKKLVSFWFNEMPKERLQIHINDDTLYSDTLKFRVDSLKRNSPLVLAKNLLSMQAYYKPYEIEFNRPISKFNESSIQLLAADSSEIEFKLKQDSIHAAKFYLDVPLNQDSSYILTLFKGAFTDIYGRKNDSLSQSFNVDNSSNYSQLSVRIQADTDAPMILELITSDEKVLRSFPVDNKVIDIKHLKAASYRLRLIFDENNNGEWDSGDYYKNKSPEKVWIYNEEITLRQNWDREITWVINQAKAIDESIEQ